MWPWSAASVHVRAIKMEGGTPNVTAGRQSVRSAARDGRERNEMKGSRFVCPAISSLGVPTAPPPAAAARLPAGRWFRGFERGNQGLCGGREGMLPAIWTIGIAWYGLIPGGLGTGPGNVDTVSTLVYVVDNCPGVRPTVVRFLSAYTTSAPWSHGMGCNPPVTLLPGPSQVHVAGLCVRC